MGPGRLGEFPPAHRILPVFIPEGIHRFIQFDLLFILLGCHPGEKIELLIGFRRQSGHLNTQLPQRCHPIPGLIKDPAGFPIDLCGNICGTQQLRLMGKMMKCVGSQMHRHTAAAFIAGKLNAERLITMTDIAGILRDKDEAKLRREIKRQEKKYKEQMKAARKEGV